MLYTRNSKPTMHQPYLQGLLSPVGQSGVNVRRVMWKVQWCNWQGFSNHLWWGTYVCVHVCNFQSIIKWCVLQSSGQRATHSGSLNLSISCSTRVHWSILRHVPHRLSVSPHGTEPQLPTVGTCSLTWPLLASSLLYLASLFPHCASWITSQIMTCTQILVSGSAFWETQLRLGWYSHILVCNELLSASSMACRSSPISTYWKTVYNVIVWVRHNQFSQSSPDGHLDCFQDFAVLSHVAMSSLVHVSFCKWTSISEG